MTGTPETDRRPRWRKKRWIAAGLLWLTAAYPLSDPPVCYLQGRGLVSSADGSLAEAVYVPLWWAASDAETGLRPGFRWFYRLYDEATHLGMRHAVP